MNSTTLTPEEFKNIFDANFDEIRSYIFYRCSDKELATDIAQDCFLKLWEKKDKIEPTRVGGLLFKMASDLFINDYQHKKRTQKIFENIRFDHDDYSPEEIMSFEQLQEKYDSLIEKMPDNQRVVFLMSRIEGLQYREIGERIGLSVKAVEKRMGNALKYLRASLITEN